MKDGKLHGTPLDENGAIKFSIQSQIEITKIYRFEAAHSLPLLPKDHKCFNLHGHSYEILVGVKGYCVPGLGWVQDYAAISCYVAPLLEQLDHKNLNDVIDGQSTAENLAIWLAERLSLGLPMLSRVEVRETPASNVILIIE